MSAHLSVRNGWKADAASDRSVQVGCRSERTVKGDHPTDSNCQDEDAHCPLYAFVARQESCERDYEWRDVADSLLNEECRCDVRR